MKCEFVYRRYNLPSKWHKQVARQDLILFNNIGGMLNAPTSMMGHVDFSYAGYVSEVDATSMLVAFDPNFFPPAKS